MLRWEKCLQPEKEKLSYKNTQYGKEENKKMYLTENEGEKEKYKHTLILLFWMTWLVLLFEIHNSL